MKLLLILLIPNLMLVLVIHQLLERKSEQKIEEINNTLLVLEHAVNREMSALFNNFTTITNQILIEPEIQRILMEDWREKNLGDPVMDEGTELAKLQKFNDNQDVISDILSQYRLVWKDIYSIAIIDSDNQVYLNTSQSYSINEKDLANSTLLKKASSKDQTGLAWSVNDALIKEHDMITIVRKIYGSQMPENIIGYVVINLSLESIQDSFETYNYFGKMIFGLVNEAQDTWMYYDNSKLSGGNGSLFKEPIASYSGLSDVAFMDKTWRTVIKRTEKQGMAPKQDYVFVGLDTSYIDEQATGLRADLYYSYAAFLALAMLISIQGTRILSNRHGIILKAMRSFGQEKWGTRIELRGSDELSIMGETFNYMASRIEQLLTNLRVQQKLKQTFELRVLEYQINPHFLYNTLDTINWMAIENNQTKISEMVNGLSKLFRMILSKGKETVSLQEEFEMIRIYLEIHQIRFENRFDYQIELDSQIVQLPIGKLILQPIVENAIIHGIRRLRTKGLITVCGKISANGESIKLEIADNGIGMPPEKIEKQIELLKKGVWEEGNRNQSGYGIKNVDSRMKLMFGDDYGMSIHSATEGESTGTTVTITLKKAALLEKTA